MSAFSLLSDWDGPDTAERLAVNANGVVPPGGFASKMWLAHDQSFAAKPPPGIPIMQRPSESNRVEACLLGNDRLPVVERDEGSAFEKKRRSNMQQVERAGAYPGGIGMRE